MHGHGFYKYKDGRRYRGQFAKDKKDGYGIYHWQDGRIYEGNWLKGKQHGIGKYIVPNSVAKFGLWEEGKRVDWYNEEQIAQINNQEYDYRVSYKADFYKHEPLTSFARPDNFE
jgi:hypothetical protein